METVSCRYDIEGLAKDMEVDLTTISTLYSEYFLEMKENIYKSETPCAKEDYASLERIIHNIKGTSISLNIKDIYYTSLSLDNQLKNNKCEQATYGINTINELFNEAEKDIKEFFHQNGIEL
ncbi:MAG: hypothetical protein F8N39_12430 [Clostridiaceae bacterium]|nr:hypothetical protein [Clostridiaceae bacterium]